MRAIWITKAGGPEALEVRETADPAPGRGQVRIAGLCAIIGAFAILPVRRVR